MEGNGGNLYGLDDREVGMRKIGFGLRNIGFGVKVSELLRAKPLG
jgi:hypothetical protein